MSQVQVGAKSLQSLIGENEILLWDSVSGSSKAIEGLSIERTPGSRNESVLLFKLDEKVWAPPVFDREVRVVIDRAGHQLQHLFLRRNRTKQEEGYFFMQVRVCLGSAPVKVLAKKATDPNMVRRDAQRVKSRSYDANRSRHHWMFS